MSPKGHKTCPTMESVQLKIHEHMTSVVGEDILCFGLDKHTTSSDVCQLRVLVLERLSVAAEWMCSLFQREMETLNTLLAARQKQLLDMMTLQPDIKLHRIGWLRFCCMLFYYSKVQKVPLDSFKTALKGHYRTL